ncbi:DinB family protein [soil metagenome]|jgi:uncharacterized damage-inducible protein DinB
MTWIAPAPTFAAGGPVIGEDRPMLEGYLAWQRTTLLNICAGLSGEQLAERSAPPSNLSLLGLVRHMAKVERIWFRLRFAGEPITPLFDPELGKDADFVDLDPSTAEDAVARLVTECRLADAAVAGLSFDSTIVHGDEVLSLRFIYLHMIAEYARHNGHADLLRQRIDGVTGR